VAAAGVGVVVAAEVVVEGAAEAVAVAQ